MYSDFLRETLMRYFPEPEPDDSDLPGEWKGGKVHRTSQGYRRLFANEFRELCIHYSFPGGRIHLERLSKVEDETGKESWNRDAEILYWQAGSETVALDKSIGMMEKVENGHIEFD